MHNPLLEHSAGRTGAVATSYKRQYCGETSPHDSEQTQGQPEDARELYA